ncbi:MAG: thiamine phosphate synthase [Lysobacter sp.]|nr:thiamine phosphate synthase [Lysobacter sp.]
MHLKASQLQQFEARPLPVDVALAASCHDVDEVLAAAALGCDFAVIGPIKPTASHPEAAGIGWERFSSLREQVAMPLYAIGGLGAADVGEARHHGAQGIAAIRALWPGPAAA